MNSLVRLTRILLLAASALVSGCSVMTAIVPNYAGCGGYVDFGDRAACAEARNDAIMSQLQYAHELQQRKDENIEELARAGVWYDAVNNVFHSNVDCSQMGAYSPACWRGFERGKSDALGVWQDTLERRRDNVRAAEFERGGGISTYGPGFYGRGYRIR